MALSRDQILSAADSKSETVNVPEWGGEVIVKVMSGTERDAWEAGLLDDQGRVDKRQFRTRLLLQTLVDDAGNTLFTEADLDALSAKSGVALDRAYQVAMKLNKLTKADEDELLGN